MKKIKAEEEEGKGGIEHKQLNSDEVNFVHFTSSIGKSDNRLRQGPTKERRRDRLSKHKRQRKVGNYF